MYKYVYLYSYIGLHNRNFKEKIFALFNRRLLRLDKANIFTQLQWLLATKKKKIPKVKF